MLRSGIYICPVCGRLASEIFYKSGSHRTGVMAYPSESRYKLAAYVPGDGYKSDISANFAANTSYSSQDKLPYEILVELNGDGTPISMRRHCPHCTDVNTPLYPGYGELQTFVIASIGDRGSGKSTWDHAVCCLHNLAAVNNANLGFTITPAVIQPNCDIPTATERSSLGKTNYLTVCDSKTGRGIAGILLLDFAGEIFLQEDSAEAQKRLQILRPNGIYPGVDAVCFFDPATNSLAGSMRTQDQERSSGTVQVFRTMHQLGLLDQIPVACIRTFGDKFVANTRRIPRITGLNKQDKVPLLSRHTFGKNESLDPKDLVPRILLENYIVSQLPASIFHILDKKRSMGFFVKSCENKKFTDTDTEYNLYTEGYNVMDVLLWLLCELRLVSLMPKGGGDT